MKVQDLLSLVPDHLLEELAVETRVDHYAKKLPGAVVFKLLLHCLLTQKDNSLRSVRPVYESLLFQVINPGGKGDSIAVSSVSDRLSTMEVDYFEKLQDQSSVPGKDGAAGALKPLYFVLIY
jgi:hypothetical protein